MTMLHIAPIPQGPQGGTALEEWHSSIPSLCFESVMACMTIWYPRNIGTGQRDEHGSLEKVHVSCICASNPRSALLALPTVQC